MCLFLQPFWLVLKGNKKETQKETNHLWGLLILRQAHSRGMIRTPSHLPSHVIWGFLKNLGTNSSWSLPGSFWFLLKPSEEGSDFDSVYRRFLPSEVRWLMGGYDLGRGPSGLLGYRRCGSVSVF